MHSNSIYTFKNQDLFIVAILLLVAIVCGSTYGPMINNGDYNRVFRSMSIVVQDSHTMQQCQSFGSLHNYGWVPTSTMAALGFTLSSIQYILGLNCFFTPTIFYTLSFMYLSGLFGISRIFSGKAKIVMVALFVLAYISMSFYFNSLYEEAIIFALSPWLLLAHYLSYFKAKHWLFLFLGSLLLFAKAQMIFLLPLLLLPFLTQLSSSQRYSKMVSAGICVIFILVSAATVARVSVTGLTLANSYNRFFNGIGWSLQGVADWPAKTFDARRSFYYANKQNLIVKTNLFEPIKGLSVYGTSFWPDGYKLFDKNEINNTEDNKALLMSIKSRLSYYGFFNYFIDHPILIIDYLKSVYWVALTSDYNISYLRQSDDDGNAISKIIHSTSNYIMRNFGWIFATAGFVTLIFSPSLVCRISVLYYFMLSPLFLVIGDGYYEFEKHAIPYFMLMPSFIITILFFSSRLRVNPTKLICTP